MSANKNRFSAEINICNNLRLYLSSEFWNVIQLVSPGGQALISYTYTDTVFQKKVTVFPDLICIKNNNILIGEVKPKFSQADEGKLLRLSKSEELPNFLKTIFSRRGINIDVPFNIRTLLIHADPKPPESKVDQLVLGSDLNFSFKFHIE